MSHDPPPPQDAEPELTLEPLSPGAVRLRPPDLPSEAGARALVLRAWRDRLLAAPPPRLRDVVAGESALLLELRAPLEAARLRRHLDGLGPCPAPAEPVERRLPVAYDGADRAALEARLGLPWAELTARHAAAEGVVVALGGPGGAALLSGRGLGLELPAPEAARASLPPGALLAAGGRAALAPGGGAGRWWLLGRSDPEAIRTLDLGDRVRFAAAELPAPPAPAPEAPGELELLEAPAGALSVRGAPAWGGGARGLPQGGALDALALEIVNGLLGNEATAPALEALGGPLALRARADLEVALGGGGLRAFLDGRELPRWRATRLPAGGRLELVPDERLGGFTAYLAVRGGLVAPAGGRALGAGASLRRRSGAQPGAPRPHPGRPRYPERIHVRVLPSPRAAAGAFERLVTASYRGASLDRAALDLTGPALPPGPAGLEAVPWGAVQVGPGGQPRVRLADRERVEARAEVALCDPRDLWQLAQAGPGTEVWFLDGRG